MKKEKQQKIESAKPTLKEKLCYALSAGLFVVGGVAWVTSLVLGFGEIVDPLTALGIGVASWGLSGAGFAVGTAGTPVERGVETNPSTQEELENSI